VILFAPHFLCFPPLFFLPSDSISEFRISFIVFFVFTIFHNFAPRFSPFLSHPHYHDAPLCCSIHWFLSLTLPFCPASKLKNGTRWLCGAGILSLTRVPFAAITSWTCASNARRISKHRQVKIAKLLGELTSFILQRNVSPCSSPFLTPYPQGRLQPRIPFPLHKVHPRVSFWFTVLVISQELSCSRWLKNRHVCPLCNREWDFQKYGS
jgi:hypothetical protein